MYVDQSTRNDAPRVVRHLASDDHLVATIIKAGARRPTAYAAAAAAVALVATRARRRS